MGDMAEVFNDMKKANKAKRAKNTSDSTKRLEQEGIEFESKNWGAHLVVQGKHEVFDFWPSTGLFISRTTGKRRRGVFNLIKECRPHG